MDKALFFSRRSLALTCVFTMLISVMVFGSTPAFAATFTVDTEVDAPDNDPGDGECEGDFAGQEIPTPTAGTCTLRAAIMEANRNGEADSIGFTKSIDEIELTIPDNGQDAGGDLDIITDTARTRIEGNGVIVIQTQEDRVFEVHEGSEALIARLEVTGGDSGTGGGFFNAGDLSLSNVFVWGNTAGGGGGVANTGVFTGTATIMEDNEAEIGAGLYNEVFSETTLLGGSIAGNFAFAGGGIYNEGFLTMDGNSIENNHGFLFGGGVYNESPDEGFFDNVVQMTSTVIVGNAAGYGGGIYNHNNDGIAFVTGSDVGISNNQAEGLPFFFGPFAEDEAGYDPARVEGDVGSQSHGGPHLNGEGGGVWNNSVVFLEHSSIDGNVAHESDDFEGNIGGEGGGVYNTGFDGGFNEVEAFEDSDLCEFIFEGALSEVGSGLCLTDSTVANNVAEGEPFTDSPGGDNEEAGKGGGIWNGREGEFPPLMGLDRTDVVGNLAAHGGGLWHHDGYAFVTETAFVENGAPETVTDNAVGGGAYVSGATEPFEGAPGEGCDTTICFLASTFEANVAERGGGLYLGTNEAIPQVDVAHSTFNDNRAEGDSQDADGGAIWNDIELDLLNSTISGNDAGDEGGGLYNQAPGHVSSNANTFNENSAGGEEDGGNVHDESFDTVDFRMTIVSNGFPVNCNGAKGESSFEDSGYNLEDTGVLTQTARSSCGFTETAGSIIGEDARLEDLNDNGGPTLTHALQLQSPALDAVDEEFCPPPSQDQRFEDRPSDGDEETETGTGCDIGSYEHQEGDPFGSRGGGGGGGGGFDPDDDPDESPSPDPSGSPTGSPSPSPTDDPDGVAVPKACRNAPDDVNVIIGTTGADVLNGTPERDFICGLGGNDTIKGLGGDDFVLGGAGDDTIEGNGGVDSIYGGSDGDTVAGGKGGDSLFGGSGNDVLRGRAGIDDIGGNRGDDTLRGGAGEDVLNGGPDTDSCRERTDDRLNCETG